MTLKDFFAGHPRVAIGFSGGVDSSYLLYEALRCGAQAGVYYVSTAFQPAFERADAMRLASSLGVEPTVLELDILSCKEVADNPPDRCYHCKRRIFGAIAARALEDGYPVLVDGTNASDDAGDRPGMRALRELEVLSPLRICGLTKDEIRRRSQAAGLFTWNKPAYACLATRTPAGEGLTARALRRTEEAEEKLQKLGFEDFRIRHRGDDAVIEVTEPQIPALFEKKDQVMDVLKKAGYRDILLNMEPRPSSR